MSARRYFPLVLAEARPGFSLRITCAECGERAELPASAPDAAATWERDGWRVGSRPQLDFCLTCTSHWSLPQHRTATAPESAR